MHLRVPSVQMFPSAWAAHNYGRTDKNTGLQKYTGGRWCGINNSLPEEN